MAAHWKHPGGIVGCALTAGVLSRPHGDDKDDDADDKTNNGVYHQKILRQIAGLLFPQVIKLDTFISQKIDIAILCPDGIPQRPQ